MERNRHNAGLEYLVDALSEVDLRKCDEIQNVRDHKCPTERIILIKVYDFNKIEAIGEIEKVIPVLLEHHRDYKKKNNETCSCI